MPMLTHQASPSDPTLLVMGDDACYHGSPGRGSQLTVRFRATVNFTQPGDTVCIVGSVQELGGWDCRRGLILSTSPETFPIWEGSVSLHFCEKEVAMFRYKHVVISSGGCFWESTSDRAPILALPPKTRAKATKEEWVLDAGWQGPEAIPHCLGYKYPAAPPLTLPLQKRLCGATMTAAASGPAASSSAEVPCQPMEHVDSNKSKDNVKENEEKKTEEEKEKQEETEEQEEEKVCNPGHQEGNKKPTELTMVPGARHLMQEMEREWEEIKTGWRQYVSWADKLAAAEKNLLRKIDSLSPLAASPTAPSSSASKTGGCYSVLPLQPKGLTSELEASTLAPADEPATEQRLRGCASPLRRRKRTPTEEALSARQVLQELSVLRKQQAKEVVSMKTRLNATAGLYRQLKGLTLDI